MVAEIDLAEWRGLHWFILHFRLRRQWKAEDTVTGFYRQKPEDTKKLLKIYNDISGLNERIYEMQTVKTAFKLYIF